MEREGGREGEGGSKIDRGKEEEGDSDSSAGGRAGGENGNERLFVARSLSDHTSIPPSIQPASLFFCTSFSKGCFWLRKVCHT